MPISPFYAEAEMEGARGQLENIHSAYMEALNSISSHFTLAMAFSFVVLSA